MDKGGKTGYAAISDYYEHLIRSGELAPGQVLPTELALAKRHGVTRTTVRRAFALLVGKGLVVKQQGRGTFVAPAAAVRDRGRRCIVIAAPRSLPPPHAADLLIEERRSYLYYHYLEGLISATERYARPFAVRYFETDEAALDRIERELRENDDLGIIPFDVDSVRVFERFATMGAPVVFLDSVTPGRPADIVRADNQDSMRRLTQHVLRTTDGPLAFIGGHHMDTVNGPHAERFAGFIDAHRACNRVFDEALLFQGMVGPRTGRDAAGHLLKREPRPAGILCSDDLTAYGVLEVLHDAKIAVPDEVSVTGFGNELYSRAMVPSLTSVAMDTRAMSLRAVQLLETRLKNPTDDPTVVTVPTRVLFRQSTFPVLASTAP